MDSKDNIVIVNTDNITAPTEGSDLYESRKNVEEAFLNSDGCEVTIFLIAYGRIEKTKKALEYLMKYTSHINFKLILCDNGSVDNNETLELFKSVQHKNKTILHITKNVGAMFAATKALKMVDTKFIAIVANDAYVTKNWLDNLLACMKSDDKIAHVAPMSSNISNGQDPKLVFKNLDEMQKKASEFNKVSDPKKWFEKVRLFGVAYLYRTTVVDLIGLFDPGFFHDFADDDINVRFLRSGYKQVLCGDTFIHHEHYHDVENNQEKFKTSLDIGRQNFQDKYHGLDAWDDLINYEFDLLNTGSYTRGNAVVLGIDVRCGVPLLEIKNKLKTNDCLSTNLFAFTTKAKYYNDLIHICNGQVECDRINFLNDYYPKNACDYIVLGEYINSYSDFSMVIENIIGLLNDGGQFIFKLKNTLDIRTFFAMCGLENHFHQEIYNHLNLAQLKAFLTQLGVSNILVESKAVEIGGLDKNKVAESIKSLGFADVNKFEDIYISEYSICVTK